VTDAADDSPGPGAGVTPLLRAIRSRRTFLDEPVRDDDLALLLDAARWAPSTWNAQPTRFVLVRRTDTEVFDAVVASLSSSNRRWAAHAPLLIVTAADPRLEDGSPNAHAWHDLGIASTFLVVQAAALGLHVQSMAGFRPAEAARAVGIPEGFEVVTVLAVGRIDPARSAVPEDVVQRDARPRWRRPLPELVRERHWDRPFGAGEPL